MFEQPLEGFHYAAGLDAQWNLHAGVVLDAVADSAGDTDGKKGMLL